MKDNSFSREARVTQVNGWLEKATTIQAGERLFEGLKRRFEKNQDSILQAVEARSRDRLENLETTLETRKQQEIENITRCWTSWSRQSSRSYSKRQSRNNCFSNSRSTAMKNAHRCGVITKP